MLEGTENLSLFNFIGEKISFSKTNNYDFIIHFLLWTDGRDC